MNLTCVVCEQKTESDLIKNAYLTCAVCENQGMNLTCVVCNKTDMCCV
jgi:hypothetical protein